MNTDEELISGGPIKRFSGGWGLLPFHGSKAHHFSKPHTMPEASNKFVSSTCGTVRGRIVEGRINMLAPGNFPKCKKCGLIVLNKGNK